MANYIRGLGTHSDGPTCCDSCSVDSACQSKPIVVDSIAYATVSLFEYHSLSPTSQWTTGATWAVPDLAIFSGMTLNTSTGIIGYAPNASGTVFVAFTATTACGTSRQGILTITTGGSICSLDISASGGNDGYSNFFYVAPDFTSARDIYVDFESYTVKDRLRIIADSVEIYNSGCIGARVTPTVNIPAGTVNVDIYVDPNCGGTSDTAWVLSITCA